MPRSANPRPASSGSETSAGPLRCVTLSSPIGALLLAGDERGLVQLVFAEGRPLPTQAGSWRQDADAFSLARQQLQAYFAGELRQFSLPLRPEGTPFQLCAWEALSRIPYGQTRSYADQAEAIGAPRAVRAVGAANGRNPLPVLVPCHRVIGRDGSLTGFGGGLPIKRWLLQLEAEGRPPPPISAPLPG